MSIASAAWPALDETDHHLFTVGLAVRVFASGWQIESLFSLGSNYLCDLEQTYWCIPK